MDDSPTAPSVPRREVVGAWLLLAGYGFGFFGLVWDIEWHSDVGPDTFFTAPHLLMYAGQAIIGLASLTVVLLASRRTESSAGPTLTVLKVFRTPLAFLVAGTGAAVGLLYGLTDLWWHTVYGFDVTPTSPPHVGLSLSDLFAAIGAILAMTALRHRRSGRWGLAVITAFALGTWTFLLYSVPSAPELPGFVTAMATLCALLSMMVLGVTRRPVWIAGTGIAFACTHLACWFWGPMMTNWYATAVSLPPRDYADPAPMMPFTFPFAFPVVAVGVSLLILAARRWNLSPGWSMAAGGSITAVLALAGYVPLGMVDGILAWPAAIAAGAVAGWLGWHAGTMAHLLAPDGQTSADDQARPDDRSTTYAPAPVASSTRTSQEGQA